MHATVSHNWKVCAGLGVEAVKVGWAEADSRGDLKIRSIELVDVESSMSTP
jgi:hypothetical protein